MDRMLEWQRFSDQLRLFVSIMTPRKHNEHPSHLKIGNIQARTVPLAHKFVSLYKKSIFPCIHGHLVTTALNFPTASASYYFHISHHQLMIS